MQPTALQPMSPSVPSSAPPSATPPPPYTVFFDGHCRLCVDSVARLRRFRVRRGADVRYVDVQDLAALSAYAQIDPVAALGQMHVLTPTGTVGGGFDAVVALLPAFRWLRVWGPFLRVPPVRAVGRVVYRWVARNRYRIAGRTHTCADGACKIA